MPLVLLAVLLALFAVAITASAERGSASEVSARAAALGPLPVPCSPAPCAQGGGTGTGGAPLLAQSSVIKLTLTPHVVHVGQIVHAQITFSGNGHCRVELGSTCGPQETSGDLVRVDCANPNPKLQTVLNPDDTSQCFLVTAVPSTPFYDIVTAPAGNCDAADCISQDYLILGGCGGGAARAAAAGADEVCCAATPRIAATARVIREGHAVEATLLARGLGTENKCGKAHLSIDRRAVTMVRQTGTTATATVRLTGSRSCISTLAATVQQSGATDSTVTKVAGGTPTFATARATRSAGGTVQVMARVEHLRPAGVCGRARLNVDGVPITTLTQTTPTVVVGRARLTGRNECATLVNLLAQQRAEVARAVRAVTGAVPTLCRVPGP